MREEIKQEDLEVVTGGRVNVDASTLTVTFSTYGKAWTIKNGVDPRDVRDTVNRMLDDHPEMTEKEFDAFAAKTLRSKGWI